MTCGQTATLNGVTIDGTDPAAGLTGYALMESGIQGLGWAEHNAFNDLPRVAGHGVVPGRDYMLPRVLRIPTVIHRRLTNAPDEPDPEAAMVAAAALKAAWAPRDDGVNQALSIYVPGIGGSGVDTLVYYGRPRGTLEMNLSRYAHGTVYMLPTFVATDPIAYGAASVTAGSGTFTVTNSGGLVSQRATITLTGNDGTPVLTNNDDSGRNITFGTVLATGETWTVDLAARTVVDSGGSDVFASNVLNASQWFGFQPGDNELVLSGASGASVSLQDAY